MENSGMREKLLAVETVNPDLREKYQEEVGKILEKPLRPIERVLWSFFALLGFSERTYDDDLLEIIDDAIGLTMLAEGEFGFFLFDVDDLDDDIIDTLDDEINNTHED